MQVRSIEFQESFARVPVEAGRQQQLLQRYPENALIHGARVSADEHLRDLNRPVPTTQTEGTIVDPDQERFPGRDAGSRRQRQRDGSSRLREEPAMVRDARRGTRIDLTV